MVNKYLMRNFIDIVEGRDPHFGRAVWVLPGGKLYEIDEEHPEWLQAYGEMLGMEAHEINSDDANFYAIRRGLTRVTIFNDGDRTNLAAMDMATARTAYRALVRAKWSNAGAMSEVMIDIYSDDNNPDEPEYHHISGPQLRSFLQP